MLSSVLVICQCTIILMGIILYIFYMPMPLIMTVALLMACCINVIINYSDGSGKSKNGGILLLTAGALVCQIFTIAGAFDIPNLDILKKLYYTLIIFGNAVLVAISWTSYNNRNKYDGNDKSEEE